MFYIIVHIEKDCYIIPSKKEFNNKIINKIFYSFESAYEYAIHYKEDDKLKYELFTIEEINKKI